MATREAVIAQLAGGDVSEGRALAKFVTDKVLGILVNMATEDGVLSCADEIEMVAAAARRLKAAAAREDNPSNEMVEP